MNLEYNMNQLDSKMALEAIKMLVNQRPWFSSFEAHINGNRAMDILLIYIQQQMVKEGVFQNPQPIQNPIQNPISSPNSSVPDPAAC